MEAIADPKVIALIILASVLAWGLAHYHASRKVSVIVSNLKADAVAVEKRVEDYADDEVVKLTAKLVARLADTSDQEQIKSDADAVIARRGQLLARVQATVAAAKPAA